MATKSNTSKKKIPASGSQQSTSSGPSHPEMAAQDTVPLSPEQHSLAQQHAGQQSLAAAQSYNALKAGEHGEASHTPQAGCPFHAQHPVDTASTVTENMPSPKLGNTPPASTNPTNGSLDRVRTDSGGRMLTTNQGVAVADNQNSLKAGLRGPSLLEDFILREKITHFDHERIPERIVHARGSAAHGMFEAYESLTEFTRAAPFAQAGKRTPVFVRFSTVAGERGSLDTARDPRGFAVKFYTEEGNWDLVGNNMPVFFIQDAMKFPDLVHAVKPEPHHGMPQASSAHDTFWDFVSLMPESAHMLMWLMSDRAIPRSYRTMQGFGVNTYRLVNEAGESVFCKFHWTPLAGVHSLVWDEAAKLGGADADFHRRDLWEAIEAGNFPEYELGLQIFTEEEAEGFGFDVLDATKLVPEELIPVMPVGKLTLYRNPDNFFAETEQVAFCPAHLIPGIDFSNDPLLQGRIHSYVDTQLSRLGGPNFHELPINAPLAEVHNNQRDGMHRQTIPRGRVAYEPNSLGGGCPFQAGAAAGFTSFREPVREDKVRGKPELFADHYSQAKLFWRSQSPIEQAHIAAAFRFELTRVQVPAIRERMVSILVNIDDQLAQKVADGLGIDVPPAQPLAAGRTFEPPVERSPALSILSFPGDGSIRGRRVALLVAEGMEGQAMRETYSVLLGQGAVPRYVGIRLGKVQTVDGAPIEAEASLEAAPSVLWDAVVLPGGTAAVDKLLANGHALEFLKDQFRHCKPILGFEGAERLLKPGDIPHLLPNGNPDVGMIFEAYTEIAEASVERLVTRFVSVLRKHRILAREMDPPEI